MGPASARVITLLQREYLFQGLNPEQIAEIASSFEQVNHSRNTLIFEEGAPADSFYIILEGHVRVTRLVGQRERLLNVLGPGEFFGEQALIFNRPRTAAVTTIEQSTLLRIGRDAFNALLANYPEIRNNLSATAESRSLARHANLDWLGADEVVYLLTRKHDFFLVLSLIGPIILGVGSVPILVMAFMGINLPVPPLYLKILGAPMLFLSLVWGAWDWIDWSNDYYIVTSQRVVWLEKVLGLYDSRHEAPLETILSVKVESSQIGRILNYGNVTVRTYTGGFLMKRMKTPSRFASFVEGYRKRTLQLSKVEEQRNMHRALQRALQSPKERSRPGGSSGPRQAPPPGSAPVKAPGPSGFKESLKTFLSVHYEKNGVITYRKHWFVLLVKIWQQGVALLIWMYGMYYFTDYRLSHGEPVRALLPMFALGLLLLFIIFLWFFYHLWDWSNDIYRLTPDQILDIEKKPLGDENKKTAPLESILSIEHERPNLLAILFNFGTVIIKVGDSRFDFFGVYNPDQVHQDIADYREALIRKKRSSEAARERDQMINWLMTYNEVKKAEETQKKTGQGEF
jgi:hypothetical protein